MSTVIVLSLIMLGGVLLFVGRPLLAWLLPAVLGLTAWALFRDGDLHLGFWVCASLVTALWLCFGLHPLRRRIITRGIFGALGKAMPTISATEREALEAGTVWWDAELFSGRPRWRRILDFPVPDLSAEERAFLQGPVEDLCRRIDEWQVQEQGDLPPAIWQFLAEQRFFGMIIPREHGGLGFSAAAHSAVVTRVASVSVTASVTIMVPNSLGPGELLLHYGTDEQKKHYLPRLARGEEIPCFALTEPGAGSDAASLESSGVVCRGVFDGNDVLGIRLDWNKRYITLAPVATVLGLAFRLQDPDHLLGEVVDLGITCALIPHDLPGVDLGRRHDPLGVPFLNGPTTGQNVFIPLDFIIGGRAMAGQGWRMLMQCLAAGRGISLPSLATGAAQLATRVVGCYGVVREQFGMPIGAFEGIEEPTARIAALGYCMNATRQVTAAAVDAGQKPAVVSAIAKHYLTELMRRTVNDAMDVQAGAAICRGPRNVLAGPYASIPVGITVEGANILTRTLIIYGQGAIRCHPHIQEQLAAVASNDLARFDRAFFRHVGFTASNVLRAVVLGCTGGRPLSGAGEPGAHHEVLRGVARYAAAFATLSDVTLGLLGGALKRKEKLSGRFADALGWMVLCTATAKRFADRGRPRLEEPLMLWSCRYGLHQVEQALLGILQNFPVRPVAWCLRILLFPLGARRHPPSDRLGHEIARELLTSRELLERLTADIHIPAADRPGLGALSAAGNICREARAVRTKAEQAARDGRLDRKPRHDLIERALAAGIISSEEHRLIERAATAREDVIQVDAFQR